MNMKTQLSKFDFWPELVKQKGDLAKLWSILQDINCLKTTHRRKLQLFCGYIRISQIGDLFGSSKGKNLIGVTP